MGFFDDLKSKEKEVEDKLKLDQLLFQEEELRGKHIEICMKYFDMIMKSKTDAVENAIKVFKQFMLKNRNDFAVEEESEERIVLNLPTANVSVGLEKKEGDFELLLDLTNVSGVHYNINIKEEKDYRISLKYNCFFESSTSTYYYYGKYENKSLVHTQKRIEFLNEDIKNKNYQIENIDKIKFVYNLSFYNKKADKEIDKDFLNFEELLEYLLEQ